MNSPYDNYYFFCLFDLKPLFVSLTNLTKFGRDSSFYFKDYWRTKNGRRTIHIVPENLDSQKVDANNRVVGHAVKNKLEIWALLWPYPTRACF